jgi:hypothetical protein
MTDPFDRLREFAAGLPDEYRDALENILADLDPADDDSPFGWASQACSEEPWWVRAEAPLRQAVENARFDMIDKHDMASIAHCGFYYIGQNTNFMDRNELLEELGCSSLAEFYAEYGCPYPAHIRAIYEVTDARIQEILHEYGEDGADIEGLATDIIGEGASSEEVIQATDELYSRITDDASDERIWIYDEEDHHVYETTIFGV